MSCKVKTYVNGKTYEAAGPTWPAAIKQLQTIIRGEHDRTNSNNNNTNTGGRGQIGGNRETPTTKP